MVADGVIVAYRDLAGIILSIADGAEAKFPADLGPFGLLDKGSEHGVLQGMDAFFPVLEPRMEIRKVV